MIRWIEQIFCDHEFARMTDKLVGRHYLECIKCLKQTPGIFETPNTVFKTIEEN